MKDEEKKGMEFAEEEKEEEFFAFLPNRNDSRNDFVPVPELV